MNQPLTLHEVNMVLVGEDHNPSILNPDFLWRNRIVPENMELDDKIPLMSSPPHSQCAFKGGTQIISDLNRITFSQSNPKENNSCHEIARKYLKTVPLVHYTAVGINIIGLVSVHNGNLTLRNMLRPGKWDQFEDTLPSPELSLIYPLADRNVHLSIKNFTFENEERVLFSGNFHRNIQAKQGESYRVAITMVDDWESDMKHFKELVSNIIKGTTAQ